jgi:hypothetical protein
MSPFVQFQVVNPEPQDPLQLIVDTGRGAVVSRSSTRARSFALDLAKTIIRTTGQNLVLIDSPAVHHSLRVDLTGTLPPRTWQILDPQRLDVARLSLDDCLLLANHAVAAPRSRTGQALLDLVRRSRAALVTMRPHDVAHAPEMAKALGHALIDVDGPPPCRDGSLRRAT